MKIFLRVLLGFVVLVVTAGILLLSQVNTDGNKQAITAAVQDATGYELTIGGDLSLDWFPTFGLSLADVRLKNPAYPQELGAASQVVLRVDLGPLLRRSLQVREIIADDFHVNYFVDADGNSNWFLSDTTAPTSAPEPTSASSTAPRSTSTPAPNSTPTPASPINATAESSLPGAGTELSIDLLQIRNASIDIQDATRNTRYQLDQLNLESRDSNVNGRPFAAELSFNYESPGTTDPVPMRLQGELEIDLEQGNLKLDNITANIPPMLVTGSLELASITTGPTYSGRLVADTFDLSSLLQSLGLMEVDPNPEPGLTAGRDLAFVLEFHGDAERASLNPVLVNVANTQIEADVEIRRATELAPMNVSYSLSAGTIDLSPFFPSRETASAGNPPADAEPAPTAANPAAQSQPATELPVDLIRDIAVQGSAAIESLVINELRFDDINLLTHVEDAVLDMEINPPLAAYEGSIQATFRLDAQQPSPTLELAATASELNLAILGPALTRFNAVTGFLNAESSYTAQGRTTDELANSLRGRTAFAVMENAVDISLIKQVFTAIAALSSSGEAIGQWPDVIRFNEMYGYHLLNDGLATNQEFMLRMDNFDISGSGGFDLDADSFDYAMAFMVLGEPHTQTIPINSLYHQVAWPVDCSAAFSDSAQHYCRPDFSQVREIFAQLGANAVRSGLEAVISEQLPDELQEIIGDQLPSELQDAARGLLRSIFN